MTAEDLAIGGHRPRYKLSRRQNAQPARPDLELHRAIPDQLAVDFHRHHFVAADAKLFGLEIIDLGRRDLRSEHDILQVADDIDVVQAFENDHIEQAVVHHRLFKKWETTAVKPAVAD